MEHSGADAVLPSGAALPAAAAAKVPGIQVCSFQNQPCMHFQEQEKTFLLGIQDPSHSTAAAQLVLLWNALDLDRRRPVLSVGSAPTVTGKQARAIWLLLVRALSAFGST